MKQLILASASTGRLATLAKIGFQPDRIINTNIDESRLPKETAKQMALRLAVQKNQAALKSIMQEEIKQTCVILSGDTVVAKGTRIADKALTDDDVRNNMQLLSSGNHYVFSAFCIVEFDGKEITKTTKKVISTRIKFKTLSTQDIDQLVETKQGIGKAGGYTIDGFAESFIIAISGSVSCVTGLPSYPVRNALLSSGIACFKQEKMPE